MPLDVFKQVGASNPQELTDHMTVVKDEALQVWMADKEISSIMTAYASNHKKQQDFKESQRTQTPLVKGKKANADLFKVLTPQDCVDVTEMPGGSSFMKATWLWGFGVDMEKTVLLPQCAAMIRFVFAGTIEVFGMPITDALRHATPDPEVPRGKGLLTTFPTWTTAEVKTLLESGNPVHYAKVESGTALYVPQGWILLEVAKEGPLVFGMRKSFVVGSPVAVDNMKACVEVVKNNGGDSSRYEEATAIAEAYMSKKGKVQDEKELDK